ncbi:hypothetical protein B0T24DRAFT_372462 [Lasiosphaeria ovina]|uniref:Uncharacterized protein n=1 Tax=Lasiosphaeria ovina TaxID=92902 RepID=A0AAE0JZJ6_9PEZI|nr:hypothetical protein B0T24DRAFT_372462 [Lasiosphaeria ovina]
MPHWDVVCGSGLLSTCQAVSQSAPGISPSLITSRFVVPEPLRRSTYTVTTLPTLPNITSIRGPVVELEYVWMSIRETQDQGLTETGPEQLSRESPASLPLPCCMCRCCRGRSLNRLEAKSERARAIEQWLLVCLSVTLFDSRPPARRPLPTASTTCPIPTQASIWPSCPVS